MTSIKQIMSNDHHHCDELFIETENLVSKGKWQEARPALDHFITAIMKHFEHEEKTLFPAFEDETGMSSGPTEMMRHEHQQMKQLLHNLDQAMNEQNSNAYLGESETLQIFMQQHNMKEEQILYPMIEQSCSPQADALMKDFINKEKSSAA